MKKLIILITVSLMIITLIAHGNDMDNDNNHSMDVSDKSTMKMDHMNNNAEGNMWGMDNNIKNR